MNPGFYFPIIAMFFVIYLTSRRRKQALLIQLMNKRNSEDKIKMKEIATRFIGKKCTVYTFDGNSVTRVIKEVSDGAILVEKNGTLEALNLDFVMRIKECPVK